MPTYKMTEDDYSLQKEQSDYNTIKSNQESSPGLYVQAGIIEHGDYDSKDWKELIKDYTEMRKGDPIVKSTLDILKIPVLQAPKKISSGRNTDRSKQAIDFVNWTFENLDKGFNYYKYHKLTAIEFGLSIHEPIIKRNVKFEGKTVNRIIKFAPIMPETVWEWLIDENTFDVNGIVQEKRQVNGVNEFVNIPIENLDIYTYNMEFDDVRGNSILRPIRMAWDAKKQMLISKVIGTKRGAGIPAIGVKSNLPNEQKARLEKIGRTIAQGQNGYFIYDMDNSKIELLEPKNQADIMQLIEFLNREIFFNTLTEFLTSGLGQNGSRAATSEHKLAYEIQANYILSSLKENLQKVTDRIINLSPFANLEPDEKPVFDFAAITKTDLSAMANQLGLLYEKQIITKRPEDELFIREFFGLPNKEIEIKSGDNIEENIQEIQEEQLTICGCGEHKKLSREINKCEFLLEKAKVEIEKVKIEADIIISEVIDKLFIDIQRQLEKNMYNDIDMRYNEELTKKLNRLYNQNYKQGITDVNLEFDKIKENTTKLNNEIKDIGLSKRIQRSIDKYYYDIKITIEDIMEKLTREYVTTKGGFDKILEPMKKWFKTSRNKIISEIEVGYIDGRGEQLKALAKEVELYFYSAILDENLCEVCGDWDGQILTKKEIEEANLKLNFPVNPECYGNLSGTPRCRCTLSPYK